MPTTIVDSRHIRSLLSLRSYLRDRYSEIRQFTEQLCTTLETEDYVIQSMPDCSPTKWHLAHTSWFFETFILKQTITGYASLHPKYDFLFNSYYNSVGIRHCRPKRGLISRPTVEETYVYRRYVDEHVLRWIESAPEAEIEALADVMELGFHHEQQHQELLITDIKHAFGSNPLYPVFRERHETPGESVSPISWREFGGGVYEFGHASEAFAFDNESPRHKQYVQPFGIATRLITAGEYLSFMADGGYSRPELWLSEGWGVVQEEQWTAPLYWWEQEDGHFEQYTLNGLRPVNPAEPIVHVSYFEADAYARWSGCRLLTEFEWEHAAVTAPIAGSFAEGGKFHPAASSSNNPSGLDQMYGEVWQWTRSQYSPYPGYNPPDGALGEYNGKFMCNQFVLRGGSCATSITHIRPTYRNFFPPEARWQFTGIRLGKDIQE